MHCTASLLARTVGYPDADKAKWTAALEDNELRKIRYPEICEVQFRDHTCPEPEWCVVGQVPQPPCLHEPYPKTLEKFETAIVP